MAGLIELVEAVFRDYVTDGVPATGPNEPPKPEIRDLLRQIVNAISSAVQGMQTYATAAELPTSPAPEAGTQARVYDDPTAENNVVWVYRDGAWTKDTDFYAGVATVVQPLVDEAEGYRDEAAASASSVAAAAPLIEDNRAIAASEAAAPRSPQRLQAARPPLPVWSLRAEEGMTATLPGGWVFNGGTGDRWAWGADGVYRDVADGLPRHRYAAPLIGGDGAYQGIILEPYGTNACPNPTMAGAATGTPGTLPTNWAESAGHGLTREILRVWTEFGVPMMTVRYSGTATAANLTLWTGEAASYVNEAGSTIAVAASQTWCASGRARIEANAAGLTGGYMVCGQTGSALEQTGFKALPLGNALRRGQAIFNTSGTPGAVRGGYRFFFTSGQPVDFTVTLALPQLEPQGYPSSEIPVAGGRRMADYINLTGAALTSRWAERKLGTMFVEFIEPEWIADGAQRTAVRLLDSTGGGRFTIEGNNNAASSVAQNWNGSVSTVVATLGFFTPSSANLNVYGPIPDSICRWAGRFGTDDTAICRDNHGLIKDASGTAFTVTAINSARIMADRPIVFREIAVWNRVFSDAAMRALTRNYQNYDRVKEFRQQDSVTNPDSTNYDLLGTFADGPEELVGFGVGAAGVRKASVRGTELKMEWQTGPTSAAAAYQSHLLPSPPRRVGMIVRWRDVANRTHQFGSVALITTATRTRAIASITGTPGSLHPTFLFNSMSVGVYSGGALSGLETVSYSGAVTYGEAYFGGYEVQDGRVIFELPDGRVWEPNASAALAAKHGTQLIWEHFRAAMSTATDKSTEASFVALMAKT